MTDGMVVSYHFSPAGQESCKPKRAPVVLTSRSLTARSPALCQSPLAPPFYGTSVVIHNIPHASSGGTSWQHERVNNPALLQKLLVTCEVYSTGHHKDTKKLGNGKHQRVIGPQLCMQNSRSSRTDLTDRSRLMSQLIFHDFT